MPFPGRVGRDTNAGAGDGRGQGAEHVFGGAGFERGKTRKGGLGGGWRVGRRGRRGEDGGPVDGLLWMIS